MAENAEILQITTKDFFDKYFDVLMSIAGRTNTELLPENISSFEMLDNRYLLKIRRADTLVYCTGKAFSDCQNKTKKPYKTILVDCYLNDMTNLEVAKKVGYSRSRFGTLKQAALAEFTQLFNYWIQNQKFSPLVQLMSQKSNMRKSLGG
ncbi:MAG: hypothetical protein ACTICX_02305 [Lactobacillus helveticus]|uniref:hypothetical protein n=1 Tax=Lactobacillus helveticus TaxID=1587 RepID=UPI0019F73CD8|nr:hypothetical protein [Lactobacillus helveticus]NRO76370.1 hypothetical protein [Lactobacillus helveticus]